jgi:hypothetical protein
VLGRALIAAAAATTTPTAFGRDRGLDRVGHRDGRKRDHDGAQRHDDDPRRVGVVIGNARDLRAATTLEKLTADTALAPYAWTGQTPEQLRARMEAEIWMSAEEAVQRCFADAITGAPATAAEAPHDRVVTSSAADLAAFKMRWAAACRV